jgi:hypothetical protein
MEREASQRFCHFVAQLTRWHDRSVAQACLHFAAADWSYPQ